MYFAAVICFLICECKDDGPCDTMLGLYVGTEDPFEPKFLSQWASAK